MADRGDRRAGRVRPGSKVNAGVAAAGADNRAEPATWRSRAFGLELEGYDSFPALPVVDDVRPGRPRATLETVPAASIDSVWRPREAERVSHGSGAESTVEEHPELGYRLFNRHFGLALVSADGSRIRVSSGEAAWWRFHRFVMGRVLPFAALLHRIEVFHASAVGLAERAAAFVAPSGGGKTSLAISLALRGCSFITDDVLAIEPEGHGLAVHPGPALASLRHAEEKQMSDHDRARLGQLLDRTDKAHFRVDREQRALPLGALYYVAREGDRIAFSQLEPPDPLLLLASTFVFEVRTPERMRNQLDVCSRLALVTPVFKAAIPPGASSSACAETIAAHIEATLEAKGGRNRSVEG